jgi:hypothetical protein
MNEIKTKEEARQYAIDWQREMSEKKITMSELIEEQQKMLDLALNWGLVEEFTNEGII